MDCLVKMSFCVFLVLVAVVLSGMNTDEVDAQMFLSEYNRTAEVVWNAYTEASWKFNTDINDPNKQAMVRPAR